MIARARLGAVGVVVVCLWSTTARPADDGQRYDFERFRAHMEDPDRARWQRPDDLVRALGLRGGETIADIGAGTGYFSVRLARAVGESGRVYAVDIDERAVAFMRQRFQTEGLGQIQVIQGSASDPLLPGAVDLVFICDTWHHIENRSDYARLLRRHLRKRGRLVIVDFKPDADPKIGPSPERRLSPKQVTEELREAGFITAPEPDYLPLQYVLISTPSATP